jgi:hypothetical protein
MSHRFRKIVAAAVSVAALAFTGAVGAASASAAPTVSAAQSVAAVTSPPGDLTAVSALSKTNAWAVGCASPTFNACPSSGVDATYHWNGTSWRTVSITSQQGSTLLGVKAIASNNVWAVGTAHNAQIAHYNGTSWKQLTVPALPSALGTSYVLRSVGASSASNVWAVGFTNLARAVTLHYNGTSWKIVPTTTMTNTDLYGVVATSATNVWAVGSTTSTATGNSTALVLRWNGTAWKIIANTLPSFRTILWGVSAVGGQAWAVGATHATANDALVLSCSTTACKRSTSGLGLSNPGGFGEFFASAATSSKDAWAVGARNVHWNGTTWKVTPLPAISQFLLGLVGAAATSTSNAWAVGSYQDSGGTDRALVLHWNGTAWKQVAA